MISNIKHNLTGINNHVIEHNLKGKNHNTNNPFIHKIESLKKHIVNNYLIPLFSKQWDILNQNVFFIDKYKDLLEKYHKIYKLHDLLVYIELIKILKLLIDKHNLLIDTEKQINNIKDPNDIVSMIYKTTMIRLVPEYEIYNSIVGRPKRELNQEYNEEIIIDIKKMMSSETVTFNKIKDFIENKYLNL
jgi:hypothetical protein